MFSIAYYIFTFLGTLFSGFQTIFSGLIIYKCYFKSSIKHKIDFKLLLVRTIFDFLNGFLYCIFYTLTIPSLTYPEYLPFQYLFIVGLIGANCLEIRSYLAAIISVERAIATFSPIKFYKYRNNISNFVIYFLVISLGLFCDVVVFGFCKAWPINPECTTLNCATTKCYQNYVSASKIIYCSINFSFCFLLTVKLFVMNCKNTTPISDVRKANILSLTDGLSTIIFELLPTMIFNYGLIDITTLGPITGALRSMGRSIEAIVMYVLMHSQSSHVQTISVESRRE